MLEREHQWGSRDRGYNYSAALFGQGAVEIEQMVRLLGGRPETPIGVAGVGGIYGPIKGARNVRPGRLAGTGLSFSAIRTPIPPPTPHPPPRIPFTAVPRPNP